MPPYYQNVGFGFELFRDLTTPAWRPPQRGALAALLAHWIVREQTPALVVIPTGSGKTAVALAAPHIAKAARTLVVVPSTQLRKQTVAAFREQDVLRRVGALKFKANPVVFEVTGRVSSWSECEEADVVVALPQSISPDHYRETTMPPVNLFELVIVDEAHHTPAPTWRAILDHFESAKKILLTATPRRRDGQRVPGEMIFHYPLRLAIADGYYKPVVPKLLRAGPVAQLHDYDSLIRDAVQGELSQPQHQTSTLLIRAASRARVAELVEIYEQVGISAVGLTSDLSDTRQAEIIEGLRSGSIRAVAVVGMLGEGFDLPRLRIAAYHDKHKSTVTTIQLIGRLVRSHPDFPQPSVLISTLDSDVYPGLKGALWDLYQEDADWSTLLPGIIDDDVALDLADKAFAEQLAPAPPELAPQNLRPLVRATVFETHDGWSPSFVRSGIPTGLAHGDIVRGQEIIYSTTTPHNRTLLFVTRKMRSPRWNVDSGLDAPEYAIHLLTYISGNRTNPPLFLVNTSDRALMPPVYKLLGASSENLRPADPARLQQSFDTLPRLSVSNVGVRNTHGGGRGSASYKMFAGSGVDRGMREADTAQAALGHAMAQVSAGPSNGAFNTGFAVEKAKMWESRYVPLREYDDALLNFSSRYRSAAEAEAPLLPAVARGVRLERFPNGPVAVVEMNSRLLASEWTLADGLPIDRLILHHVSSEESGHFVTLAATRPDTDERVWSGLVDATGNVTEADLTRQVHAVRGYSSPQTLCSLFTENPPTIYFYDGQTVSGATLYRPPSINRDLTRWAPEFLDWSLTNIEKETDASAARAGEGLSVHETLRTYLRARPTSGRRRWVLENDGSGELADLIVLELYGRYDVVVELWHAKPSTGASPGARVTDMQVVVAQAIKSRRWLTDRGLWAEMADRYSGKRSPRLQLVQGSEPLLRTVLGLVEHHPAWSLAKRPSQVRGKVVIAQPGLSWLRLTAGVAEGIQSALQIRDLLAVFDDALGALGDPEIFCSP